MQECYLYFRQIIMYIPAEKMKNKKSHTVGTVPRSTRNIVEKGKFNAPNTQIHDVHIPDLVQALQ